jgi:hypothetical protein
LEKAVSVFAAAKALDVTFLIWNSNSGRHAKNLVCRANFDEASKPPDSVNDKTTALHFVLDFAGRPLDFRGATIEADGQQHFDDGIFPNPLWRTIHTDRRKNKATERTPWSPSP